MREELKSLIAGLIHEMGFVGEDVTKLKTIAFTRDGESFKGFAVGESYVYVSTAMVDDEGSHIWGALDEKFVRVDHRPEPKLEVAGVESSLDQDHIAIQQNEAIA